MALRGLYKLKRQTIVESKKITKVEWKIILRKSRKYIGDSFYWLYEGQTIQNISHGFGTLTKVYKDGTFKKIHTGQWVNGQKHGIGESWLNDGSYYSGDLFEGKKQGFGRIWLNDGSFYQGYWKNNLYDGVGMLIQSNGNRYEGEFSNGMKEGTGSFYHLKTGQVQEGHWSNNYCTWSTMRDLAFRQSAITPTAYPVPMTNLWIKMRGNKALVQFNTRTREAYITLIEQ